MKRRLTYAGIVVVTMVLTTLLQPLSYLSTFAQPSGCQTFKETGKTVCGKFLAYWQQHGGLAQQGYPISQEFTEKSELDGKEYTVQYFERAVFELHPENQPPFDVLLSQLGTFRYRQKYPNAEPTSAPAPPPGLNMPVMLRGGVTITLVPSGGGYDTGLQPNRCFGTMVWLFKLDNTSDTGYTVNVDTASLSMADSTGKPYPPESRCIGAPFLGDFRGPVTVAAKKSIYGAVMFNPTDLPTDASYLDMRMAISGTTLTFRYPLR